MTRDILRYTQYDDKNRISVFTGMTRIYNRMTMGALVNKNMKGAENVTLNMKWERLSQ